MAIISKSNPRAPLGSEPTNNPNSLNGFTLIEILITILLTAFIGTIASTSFFTLLRSGAKTELLKEVKQNGDYALSVMEIKIRNARTLNSSCDGTVSNSISIINPDDSTSTFSCVSDGALRRIQEEIFTNPPPLSISNFLTSSLVTISGNCNSPNIEIMCTTGSDGITRLVRIQFTLSQANENIPTTEQASQTFKTQISLRNK